jgi:hypothetical protein
LLSNDSLTHRTAWEISLTARILALLGYVATTPDIDMVLMTNSARIDVDELLLAIPTLSKLITKAEESSHLPS